VGNTPTSYTNDGNSALSVLFKINNDIMRISVETTPDGTTTIHNIMRIPVEITVNGRTTIEYYLNKSPMAYLRKIDGVLTMNILIRDV